MPHYSPAAPAPTPTNVPASVRLIQIPGAATDRDPDLVGAIQNPWLADAHCGPVEGEIVDQGVRDILRKRLQQQTPIEQRQPVHRGHDGSVVDRIPQLVGVAAARAIEIQFQVDVQWLALLALVTLADMQGNVLAGLPREQAMQWLADGLIHLGKHAATLGVKLIYEPLNRYETNLINTLGDGVQFLKMRQIQHVGLLADLFHMNIEEEDLAASIRKNARWIRHVHFADSNRRAIGFGHTEMTSVAKALQDIGYYGYVSAEAFPWPDSDAAAAQTIQAFNHYFTR